VSVLCILFRNLSISFRECRFYYICLYLGQILVCYVLCFVFGKLLLVCFFVEFCDFSDFLFVICKGTPFLLLRVIFVFCFCGDEGAFVLIILY
jgi:hypothetical protein